LLGRSLVASQRFEYKYLISEVQAAQVRAFASCYLVPDSHIVPALGNEYPVYSLYLDSHGLHLYHSSVAGHKDRFKLRVRFYDERPDTPAFLEVKARKGEVVVKQRAEVRKSAVGRVLSTYCGSPDDLLKPASADRGASSASASYARNSMRARGCSSVTCANRTRTPGAGRSA